MSDCTVCSRPAPDAYLCPGCIDILATELRTVPWLVEQLDVTLTRQARMGDRNGPRATERPLVFDPAASVDLETLRDGLWMWAMAVAQQRDITVEVHKEPVAVSRWLLRWMGAVAQHADAAELHGDITNMIRSARRTIDRPVDRRYIGPCEDCGSDLYVNDYGTGRLPQTVVCVNLVEKDDHNTGPCGAEYPMVERRAWLLEQAMNQLLTPAEITRAIGELFEGRPITANMVSRWAATGLRIEGGRKTLTPYPHHPRDPYERNRYLVEEVVAFYRAANGIHDKQGSAAA